MNRSEAYKYCVVCGHKIDEHSEMSVKCTNCNYELFLDYSTSVGALIFNEEGKVLFIRRGKNPHKGSLDFPAGFVDIKDNDLEFALRREIKEELRVDIDNLEYFGSFNDKNNYEFRGIKKPLMCVVFKCKITKGQLPQITPEVESFDFYSINDLNIADTQFDTVKNVIKKLQS